MRLLIRLIILSIVFTSMSCYQKAFSKEDNDIDSKLLKDESVELFLEKNPEKRLKNITALYESSDNYNKYVILPILSKSAIAANEIKLAANYAKTLLKLSEDYKGDWNYGNAIHDANIVLGMVSLKDGDVQGAKRYLLEAGKAPTSPQLSVYGPNVMLAKALLEKGENETVITYLEEVKNLWLENNGRLDCWISTIKGGGMPDFDLNLYL